MIISSRNVTEIKALKPWSCFCAIASPARINICKAKKKKKTEPTNKKMHTVLQEKRQNYTFPQKPQPLSWVSLCGRLLYEHDIYWNMLRASDIIIFYSRYCVFLDTGNRWLGFHEHIWLITWFCLIYKISKSSCFLPDPWFQILPCNIKKKKKWSEIKIPVANQP